MLFLMVLVQLYWSGYCINFFVENGYLPAPFIYDKSDTFMDFFHPMFWAGEGGRYTEWGSVYPPLNFIILNVPKWLFLNGQSFSDAFSLREAGLSLEIFLVGSYLIIPLLVLKTASWKNFTLIDKALIYLVFILSTPLLFALERGNLIILTLILLALAISHSGIYRLIFIALLVNIKPYFVILILLFVIKRKWGDLALCIAVTGIIFLITGLLLDNNFYIFFENLLHFSSAVDIFSYREVISMPSSLSAYSTILSSDILQGSSLLSFIPNMQVLADFIEFTKWSVLLLVLGILLVAHEKMSELEIIAVLVVWISNLGTWVGGYTLILYFTLIPIFIAMRFKWAYFCILGLIFSSVNVFPLIEGNLGVHYSYLSNTNQSIDWLVDFHVIIKPLLNFVLLVLLSYEMIIKTHIITSNSPMSQKL